MSTNDTGLDRRSARWGNFRWGESRWNHERVVHRTRIDGLWSPREEPAEATWGLREDTIAVVYDPREGTITVEFDTLGEAIEGVVIDDDAR